MYMMTNKCTSARRVYADGDNDVVCYFAQKVCVAICMHIMESYYGH